MKIESINDENLTVSIKIVGNDIGQFNGHFSVVHKECPNKQCGSTTKDLPLAQGQRITIETNLSPCRNYSRLEIRAHKWQAGAFVWDKDWTAIDCPHQTTTTTTPSPSRTTTENVTIPETGSSSTFQNNTLSGSDLKQFFTEKSYKNSIILCLCLSALISTSFIAVLCKKKIDEKKREEETTTTGECPVCGFYEEGAVYIVQCVHCTMLWRTKMNIIALDKMAC